MLGVSDDVLSNIIRGVTKLSPDRRKKAAQLLNIDEDSLRKRKGTVLGPEKIVYRTPFRQVPVFGSVPAGKPSIGMSDAIEFIEMPDWGSDFERWGRVISGDSMLDEFEPGDIVVFEDRYAEDNRGVYAWKEGEDTFKVLRTIRGEKQLWPTNSEYDPFSAEGWNIYGIAIERYRRQSGGVLDIRKYPHGYIWRPPRP